MTEDGDGTLSAGASPMPDSGSITHRRHSSRIKGLEEQQKLPKNQEFRPTLRWPDLTAQVFIHAGCLYGFYLIIAAAKLYTSLFGKLVHFFVSEI